MTQKRADSYVYSILVDGVVRYIGKGSGNRCNVHMQIVRQLAAGITGNPKEQVLHRRLLKPFQSGAVIKIVKIATNLTDDKAYEVERREIANTTSDLWNVHEGGLGASSEFARQKWADPIYRSRQEAAQRDPAVIDRKRKANTAAQNRPDVRERVKAGQRAAFSRPEFKAKQVASVKERWKNPEYRAAVVAGRKAQWTPEARAKQALALKAYWEDPERRKARSDQFRKHWADPVARESHCRGMKSGWNKRRAV